MDYASTGGQVDIRLIDENTLDSIRRNYESDSMEIDQSDMQQLKWEESRISSLRGMPMNAREELENPEKSIHRHYESDSIETDEYDPESYQQEERETACDSITLTKYSACVWTISPRRPRRMAISNLVAIAPSSSRKSATTSIVTAGWSESRRSVPTVSENILVLQRIDALCFA
jgi:hypothetical protein